MMYVLQEYEQCLKYVMKMNDWGQKNVRTVYKYKKNVLSIQWKWSMTKIVFFENEVCTICVHSQSNTMLCQLVK